MEKPFPAVGPHIDPPRQKEICHDRVSTIETARTDVTLRKMGQFFATHIHDVSAQVMGTAELREQIDAVALHIRGPHGTVAAINSHPPISFALGASTSLGDLDGAVRLLMETRLLEHLAVAPRHRGRGYARALLDAAELPGAANIIRRSRISRTGTWIYKKL